MFSPFGDGYGSHAVNQGAGYIEDGRSQLYHTWVVTTGCKLEYRLQNGTLRFTMQNPVVDALGYLEDVEIVDHANGNAVLTSDSVSWMTAQECQGVF
jgi:hypothetical protein